jgi:Tfp pilus assembly protein PilZ
MTQRENCAMGKKKRNTKSAAGRDASVLNSVAPSPSERRQYLRGLPQDLQVDVYVEDDLHTGSARNLSEGGVFIQGGPSVAVGDEVIVSLQPTLDEPVYLLRAEVRGIQDEGGTAGIGVRFIEPESDLVAACRSMVQPAAR